MECRGQLPAALFLLAATGPARREPGNALSSSAICQAEEHARCDERRRPPRPCLSSTHSVPLIWLGMMRRLLYSHIHCLSRSTSTAGLRRAHPDLFIAISLASSRHPVTAAPVAKHSASHSSLDEHAICARRLQYQLASHPESPEVDSTIPTAVAVTPFMLRYACSDAQESVLDGRPPAVAGAERRRGTAPCERSPYFHASGQPSGANPARPADADADADLSHSLIASGCHNSTMSATSPIRAHALRDLHKPMHDLLRDLAFSVDTTTTLQESDAKRA